MARQSKKTRKKQNLSAGVLLGFFLALVAFAGYQAIAERREEISGQFFAKKGEDMSEEMNNQNQENQSEENVKENPQLVDSEEKKEVEEKNTEQESQESKEEKPAIGGPGNQDNETYQSNYGYSIEIPANWYSDDSVENRVAFGEQKPTKDQQYFGNLVVVVVDNPENKNIEEFYNPPDQADLFADALGGYEKFTVNNVQGYKFYSVEGYIPSNVIVLKNPKTNQIIEMTDIGGQLEQVGKFDQIIGTISLQ